VTVLPVAEAAQRIRGRSIRLELVRALDFWSGMRRRRNVADNHGPDWKALLTLARLADPDPWRNQLREAVERRDRNGLEALAAAANIRQLDPGSLHLLGLALIDVGATDQAEHFLRQTQRQYPGDLWLNDALGACLYPSDETVRFFTANVAGSHQANGIFADRSRSDFGRRGAQPNEDRGKIGPRAQRVEVSIVPDRIAVTKSLCRCLANQVDRLLGVGQGPLGAASFGKLGIGRRQRDAARNERSGADDFRR